MCGSFLEIVYAGDAERSISLEMLPPNRSGCGCPTPPRQGTSGRAVLYGWQASRNLTIFGEVLGRGLFIIGILEICATAGFAGIECTLLLGAVCGT